MKFSYSQQSVGHIASLLSFLPMYNAIFEKQRSILLALCKPTGKIALRWCFLPVIDALSRAKIQQNEVFCPWALQWVRKKVQISWLILSIMGKKERNGAICPWKEFTRLRKKIKKRPSGLLTPRRSFLFGNGFYAFFLASSLSWLTSIRMVSFISTLSSRINRAANVSTFFWI